MPFQKGRVKTGGRTKGGKVKKSNKLIDQLKDNGFNYVKELAGALRDIRDLRLHVMEQKADPEAYAKMVELKFFYNELKSLLLFMAPKLREKEVELVEEQEQAVTETPISSEDLLKVFNNGTEKETYQRRSNPPVVAKRDIELQVPPGPETNLQDMVGESKDN